MSASRREEPGGIRGEEPGVVAGRDEERQAARRCMRGGHDRGEARARDPRLRARPGRTGASASPIRATSGSSIPHSRVSPSTWTAIRPNAGSP